MNTRTKPETAVVPLLRKHAILCVDDEPSILAALRRTLSKEPYDLYMTEDPWHALQYVESRPVSLVLSDQRMPEMSGFDMLQAVQKCSPSTIGVILTGYPETYHQRTGIGEGVRCVLLKPWDNPSLTRTLRLLLREMELNGIEPTLRDENEGWDLGGES
ncbi:MAG TPA: response regulator [Planctomycetota bacterium]|nr:response regulator [Planctomycetota bacterium]